MTDVQSAAAAAATECNASNIAVAAEGGPIRIKIVKWVVILGLQDPLCQSDAIITSNTMSDGMLIQLNPSAMWTMERGEEVVSAMVLIADMVLVRVVLL